MRIDKTFVLSGVAALALAGCAGLALAQPLHSLLVPLPDGGVAQIQMPGTSRPAWPSAPRRSWPKFSPSPRPSRRSTGFRRRWIAKWPR